MSPEDRRTLERVDVLCDLAAQEIRSFMPGGLAQESFELQKLCGVVVKRFRRALKGGRPGIRRPRLLERLVSLRQRTEAVLLPVTRSPVPRDAVAAYDTLAECDRLFRELLEERVELTPLPKNHLLLRRELLRRCQRAIAEKLPEDEPDTIPDWCYQTIINTVVASMEKERTDAHDSTRT